MANEQNPNTGTSVNDLVTVQQSGVIYLGRILQAIQQTFPNWVAVPGSATASGVPGQTAYDATHIYVCVAPNTWVRATLSTF